MADQQMAGGSTMSQIISTGDAPAAIGPYVQARMSGGWLFSSGQIGLDPASGVLVEGGIEAQTRRVLANIQAILDAAGCHRKQVVKTVIFLKDMSHFALVNELYASFFGDHKPARSTVEVARLPKDALIEIETIAEL